jgi:hypothetical protein
VLRLLLFSPVACDGFFRLICVASDAAQTGQRLEFIAITAPCQLWHSTLLGPASPHLPLPPARSPLTAPRLGHMRGLDPAARLSTPHPTTGPAVQGRERARGRSGFTLPSQAPPLIMASAA